MRPQGAGCDIKLCIALLLASVTCTVQVQFDSSGAAGTSIAPVVADAAGVCPPATGLGICVEECSDHAECHPKLCCSNGCGHVCLPAADANMPPEPTSCVITATLKEDATFAALLQLVPAPVSHQELAAVRILILNYGQEHEADCCEAAKSLKEAPSAVNSVEFDSMPPPCAS